MLYVPESVVVETESALKGSGTRWVRHEGVAYWAGRAAGGIEMVLACIVPRARTSRGNFQVSAQENARAIGWMCEHDLELIAQVHSHPGSFVTHSAWDDEHAFLPFEGLWSIIVPHYARSGMRPISRCGVHRFQAGEFRVLELVEVNNAIRLIPSLANLRSKWPR